MLRGLAPCFVVVLAAIAPVCAWSAHGGTGAPHSLHGSPDAAAKNRADNRGSDKHDEIESAGFFSGLARAAGFQETNEPPRACPGLPFTWPDTQVAYRFTPYETPPPSPIGTTIRRLPRAPPLSAGHRAAAELP